MTSRICYRSDESFVDTDSRLYVVAKIVENETGFYVHETFHQLADAVARAKALNDELGLTDKDVSDIVMSSMFPKPDVNRVDGVEIIGKTVQAVLMRDVEMRDTYDDEHTITQTRVEFTDGTYTMFGEINMDLYEVGA